MTAAKDPLPGAEDQWFTHDPNEPLPRHERIISEARAVQEALARLGPAASDEAVRRDLERVGMRLDLARVAEIRAEMRQAGLSRAGGAPAPSPSDLVRTEGETVPPPRPGAAETGPAPPRQGRPARPSDLVKTEGEPVPPPRP